MLDLPPCAAPIAAYYQVSLPLLAAIRTVEAGTVGQMVGPNRNGTYDLGPLQVNTSWSNLFSRYHVAWTAVRDDYCTNLMAGAFVLRYSFELTGDWNAAVAAYNAGIKARNTLPARRYAKHVFRALRWIQRRQDR